VRSGLLGALIVAAPFCFGCDHPQNAASQPIAAEAPPAVADKPFVAKGTINLDLDGGSYEIKPGADSHIRVALSGTIGNAKADIAIDGNHADVKVKDTPHNNFHAVVDVPAEADIVVRLAAGELTIGPVTGNKDVESYAGNVEVTVSHPEDYARVDTAVKAGEIDAAPFGGRKSGLLQEFTWSGSGKYTLRAHLGAGNLVIGK
jgi:hypothetical protein